MNYEEWKQLPEEEKEKFIFAELKEGLATENIKRMRRVFSLLFWLEWQKGLEDVKEWNRRKL